MARHCSCFGCLRQWRVWIRPITMTIYSILLLVVLPLLVIRLQQNQASPQVQAWFISGLFVLMTLPITMWEIVQHLVHYTKPSLQKHIVRILWMVPIYAMNAWLSLLWPKSAIYLDTLRECYEAYVIYNFLMYLLNFLNLEIDLEVMLSLKPPVKHLPPLCCCAPWKMGRELIDYCKHGILQFAVIRPITTIIAFITAMTDSYGEGVPSFDNAYPYLLFVNNVSQFVAMYCLTYFYRANKEELAPMSPLSKFLCIKAVIFFSFFQSVVINIFAWTGFLRIIFGDVFEVREIANSLQDFLICLEMFVAAIAHLYAFSHKPFIDPEFVDYAPSCESFLDILYGSDFQQEVHQHVRVVGSTAWTQVSRIRPSYSGSFTESVPNVSVNSDERTCLLRSAQGYENSTGNNGSYCSVQEVSADVHENRHPSVESINRQSSGSESSGGDEIVVRTRAVRKKKKPKVQKLMDI